MMQRSISSELLMRGVGVRSNLWRMFIFISVVVIVWGSVGMFVA